MTEQELQSILEYCGKATEGPWVHYGIGGITSKEWDIAYEGHGNCQECGAEVSQVPFINPSDAEFCAHSRTDLPAVVRELMAARRALRSWVLWGQVHTNEWDMGGELTRATRAFLGGTDESNCL